MPTFPIIEANIANNKVANGLPPQSNRLQSAEAADVPAGARNELAKATILPPGAREPAVLSTLAAQAPKSGAARHDAAAALMRAGEIFLQLGETEKGREYLCRAHAELELSLKTYLLDDNIRESLATCARLLEKVNGFSTEIITKPAAQEITEIPAPTRAKDLKLVDRKKEKTLEIIEEPKTEPVRRPSVPIWSGNLFLLLGLTALSFYGIATGLPHELLSRDNFFTQLSHRVIPHTLKGSFIAAVSFAVLWFFWERINRYRLVLSSKADAYAPRGLAIRLVLVISMLGTAFYLADTVYHFLRGA